MPLGEPDQARRHRGNNPGQLCDTLRPARLHRASSPLPRPKPCSAEPVFCSAGLRPGRRLVGGRRDFLHDTCYPPRLWGCGKMGQARGRQVRQVALRRVRHGRSPLPRGGCSIHDRGRVEHRPSPSPPRERRSRDWSRLWKNPRQRVGVSFHSRPSPSTSRRG